MHRYKRTLSRNPKDCDKCHKHQYPPPDNICKKRMFSRNRRQPRAECSLSRQREHSAGSLSQTLKTNIIKSKSIQWYHPMRHYFETFITMNKLPKKRGSNMTSSHHTMSRSFELSLQKIDCFLRFKYIPVGLEWFPSWRLT
jgi:hypothetical protein